MAEEPKNRGFLARIGISDGRDLLLERIQGVPFRCLLNSLVQEVRELERPTGEGGEAAQENGRVDGVGF